MAVRQVLAEPEWRARSQQHRDRVGSWTAPRLQRRTDGIRHPVDDFLWEYYRWRPGQLTVWHPGLGIALQGTPEFADRPPYQQVEEGWTAVLTRADPLLPRLTRNLAILSATAGRPVRTGCFGMHEWAMVHGLEPQQIRHEQVPLRLSPGQIRSVVAEVGLQCTHFDAFRFFTASALPLQTELTRAGQLDDEQPGCIHAGMDLYRYAYEAAAYAGSDLVADCFEHARRARELDMRASPYDLTAWGLEPVPVETVDGRRQYVRQQRELAVSAASLRSRLIDNLTRTLASAATGSLDPAQSA